MLQTDGAIAAATILVLLTDVQLCCLIVEKARKAFFFGKKKQKTFERLSRLFPESRDSGVRSFLVLFKKGLLAF